MIMGVVSDFSGFLSGANVFVKNINVGTTIDFDGKFILEGVFNDVMLVISYLGYTTQEINVAGKSNINVTLVADAKALEEEVVVGYGTQKKSLVTGAIASVKSDQFQDVSV